MGGDGGFPVPIPKSLNTENAQVQQFSVHKHFIFFHKPSIQDYPFIAHNIQLPAERYNY